MNINLVKYKKFLVSISVLMIFFVYIDAKAAITFDSNGKWETTFNYPECMQRGAGSSLDCATVQNDGIYWSWGATGLDSVDGMKYTQVTTNSNNPVGRGGNGARFWKGSVVDDLTVSSDNLDTGTIRINFTTPQKELWIRWYERYENEFEWKLFPAKAISPKSIYLRAGPQDASNYIGGSLIGQLNGANGYRIYNQGGWAQDHIDNYSSSIFGGWNTIYPDIMANGVGKSDGSWHSFEIYLKMDTVDSPSSNGGGYIWVDGILLDKKDNINWSGGDVVARDGWTWMEFLSNQKNPGLDRPYYVDLDDMVIQNTTPLNVDSYGNPFIGPIVNSPATYSILNFTDIVTSWLNTGSSLNSDLNSDNIVNTKDLGVMMSKWE